MIRNLKALGLAFVAVFAMSAIAATGAQAHMTFKADGYPSGIETVSSSAQEFVSEGQEGTEVPFVCPGANFSASDDSITGPSTTVLVDVEYLDGIPGNPCLAAGVFEVEVEENGCQFLFHSQTTLNSDNSEGDVDIVNCDEEAPGIEIFIAAVGCEIFVPEQTVQGTASAHPIHYEDETNGYLEVSTTPELASVEYEDNANCLETAGVHNATYEGSGTITGTNEAGETTEIGLQ